MGFFKVCALPIVDSPAAYILLLLFVLRIERIREQGLVGLVEDLGKLGILSFTLFHTDSLSLSLPFFMDNEQVWLMNAPWYDPHLAKAQMKLYRRCIFTPRPFGGGIKVGGMSALKGWDLTDSVTRFILVKNTLVVWNSSSTASQAIQGNTFSLPRATNAAHNHSCC